MGGLFSSQRQRKRTSAKRGRYKHKSKIKSSSHDNLLQTGPSIADRKTKLFKSLSAETLGVEELEVYVKSKDQRSHRMSSEKFEKECITAHNQYRKTHGVAALSRKSELSNHAQKWANHLASIGTLKHSQNRNYGENVAMTTKENPSGKRVTRVLCIIFCHLTCTSFMI